MPTSCSGYLLLFCSAAAINLPQSPVRLEEWKAIKGASIYDIRKFFGFFDPLPPIVRKFTQPPLLRLLTMSAFEDTPLPPQCGRHKWKPPEEEDSGKIWVLRRSFS